MTKRLVHGICANHNDAQLLIQGGSSATTLQATSPAPNSYTPPSGAHRWIRLEGGGGSAKVTGISDPSISANLYVELSLAYIPFALLLDASLVSGDASRMITFFLESVGGSVPETWNLECAYDGATDKYKLLLTTGNPATETTSTRTVKATGTTTFTTLEILYGRITIDGTNISVHVQENDADLSGLSVEMVAASTKIVPDDRRLEIKGFDDLASGEYLYADCLGIIEADSSADRPNADWVVNRIIGDGEGTAQAYGDDGDCNPGSTSAVYTDVALDGSLQVVTSSFWCENGGQAGSQEMTLAAFTPAGTLVGITVHALIQASLSAKTTNTDILTLDASSTHVWENTTVQDTWVAKIACLEHDPSGNEWDALGNLNAIQVGARSDSSNGANDQWAAEFVQTYEIGSDPLTPPVAGVGRRRVHMQLV